MYGNNIVTIVVLVTMVVAFVCFFARVLRAEKRNAPVNLVELGRQAWLSELEGK